MAVVEVYTEQQGICVSKEYKEAKEERVFNGQTYPATPEKFIVKVVSCTPRLFSKETGMPKPVVLDYEIDKATYNKIKFETWMKAKVGFTVVTYGKDVSLKPEYFELLNS